MLSERVCIDVGPPHRRDCVIAYASQSDGNQGGIQIFYTHNGQRMDNADIPTSTSTEAAMLAEGLRRLSDRLAREELR